MTSKAPQFALIAQQLDADGRKALAEVEEGFDKLSQRVATLEHLMFGRKSERMPPLAKEVRRTLNHDEVTKLAARTAEEDGRAEVTKADEETARPKIGRRDSEPARKKSRAARKAALPVVHEVREVTAADLPDGMTLDDFELMGYEEVRRVELVRAHLVEVVYRLPKLRAKAEPGLIVQAKSPPAPVKGGLYGASVYAHLLHSRVVVGTPLNRLAKTSAANGVLAPSVAIGLFHRGAALLWPLYLLLVEQVRNASHVYADETSQPYQVPGKTRSERAGCGSRSAIRPSPSSSPPPGRPQPVESCWASSSAHC